MKKIICTISVLPVFLLICSYIPAQHFANKKIKVSAPVKKIIIKYGVASFYAKKFNGRRTSDGSVFDSEKMTAACNVLPLGTWVKVTNLSNERSVVLHITDRMHRKNKRLIDVSKNAARQLRFVGKGITRVRVEVLDKNQIANTLKLLS
jgi:rare lipoprotein A